MSVGEILLVIIFLTLNGCASDDNYVFHKKPPATGKGKIEHMVTHPLRFGNVNDSSDNSISVYEAYIVWGELAKPDTRANREIFDEYFCTQLPNYDLSRIALYVVSFYAGCNITTNEVLNRLPNLYDQHTIGADNLRSYVVRYGKLESVDEVYDERGFAQVTEGEDYTLYCLTEAESDTLK